MARFVLDASAVLRLASEGIATGQGHTLLAPTLLRSQVLSTLHEAVQRGELPAAVARERLARIGRMPIRYLGDAVLQRFGWASTYEAEYLALTQLQADALITEDPELRRQAEGIVTTASLEVLGGDAE